MEGQNGVWCSMWCKGVCKIWGFSAPSLASLSTSSMPWLFVCALIFLTVMFWFGVLMACIMCVMKFAWVIIL